MKEKIWNFAVLILCPIWCYYSSFSWLKYLMGTLQRNIWHIDSLKSWMSQLLRPLKSTLILILNTLFFLMKMQVKQLPVKKTMPLKVVSSHTESHNKLSYIVRIHLGCSWNNARICRKILRFCGVFFQLFLNLVITVGLFINLFLQYLSLILAP